MSKLTAELPSSDYARQVLGGLTKLPEDQSQRTPQRELAAKITQGLLNQLNSTAFKKGGINVLHQSIDLDPTEKVDTDALDLILGDFKAWISWEGGEKPAVFAFGLPILLTQVPEGGQLVLNTANQQVKLMIDTDNAGSRYHLGVMVGGRKFSQ